MHFAIVEDELVFMKDLQNTIFSWKPADTELAVDTFYTGEELLQCYRTEQKEYDIIFMDIKLSGMDGLTVSNKMRQLGYENAIVFTTNHTDFELMQQSYDVSALHYFEKPVTIQNIEACVKMLRPLKKYVYTYKEKQIGVPFKEIVYFESARNYITIHTLHSNLDRTGKHRKTLNDLLSGLPDCFVQCHRSFVVNISHVIMIENKNLYVRTSPNKPLPIGDRYLDNILTAFQAL